MKTFIYILSDPITEEVRYVGKSIDPNRRYQSHLGYKPKIKYHSYYGIQKLIKNGFKPVMTIIDEIDNDEGQGLEQYGISQFKQGGFRLTNITNGGEGSSGVTQHGNNKIVSCYDKFGNYIKTYPSLKSACEYYNIHNTHLISALNEKLILCDNVQGRYGNNTKNINPIVVYGKMTKHLKIAQYNKNDELIEIFESIKDISIKLNYKNTANIYQCINNKRKTCYGYKGKLYEESVL